MSMIVDSAYLSLLPAEMLRDGRKKMAFPALAIRKSYIVSKRIFDLCLSAFLLLALMSWLLPIIALAIKLDSHGPVFFKQSRVGRKGKRFLCFKFRTMIINAEAHEKQAENNDDRITRLGRLLRITNIDEFPQVLNVLIGDMSFVGPRPHMHSDHRRFASLIAGYEFRCLVKPGITGLAQIKGFSGPTLDTESILGRYKWDAFYVRRASFWFDLKIVWRTLLLWSLNLRREL
jgi:putative colanic acid biosynthesis UDP-glucose lipid carrier transferase